MPNYQQDVFDTRSEEIQELISRTPNWLIRWGITVLFFILILLGIISYVVKYPDIVKAPLVMTSLSPPRSINPKINAKLTKLFVKEGDVVKEGSLLGFLESVAHPDEVLSLSKDLMNVQKSINLGNFDNLYILSNIKYNHLGELQTAYQTFNQSFFQLQSFLLSGYFVEKKDLLQQEFRDLESLSEKIISQKELYQKEYSLAEKDFLIQKHLESIKVLAPLDLIREEGKVISKEIPIRQIEQQTIGNRTLMSGKKKEILELNKQAFELKNNFIQSFNTLISSIEEWKTKYIIISPAKGRVSFSSILQEKQLLMANQEIFFITPFSKQYFGVVKIPQMNFGKVKKGQQVLIKFNGYPFEEFGIIDGKVSEISEVPAKDSTFLAKIILSNGLKTNYNKTLTYKIGMNASAEIITEDKRLIERFFHSFVRNASR